MSFDDCIRRGLLKKDESVKNRVKSSLEIAERFLRSAERTFEIEDFVMVQIAAYNSVFHCGRALLFAKGYRERSHRCLIVALRRLYGDDSKLMNLINIFDRLRIQRHNVQYGGALISREEAKFIINYARNFLETVKEILKTYVH